MMSRSIRGARWLVALVLALAGTASAAAYAEPNVLLDGVRHLRQGGAAEWAEFPHATDGARLELPFESRANAQDVCLSLRQRDVKQAWKVRVNDRVIGDLVRDENAMVVCLTVPAGVLRDGINVLLIEAAKAEPPDDVEVGSVVLHSRSRADVLRDGTLVVHVLEENGWGAGEELRAVPVPARVTVLTEDGSALQETGAQSGGALAVRAGVVLTGNGDAEIPLPAGRFVVRAGRGFEYSLGEVQVELKPGERIEKTIRLRRVVPTEGYVACDTHVHTLTHSGHGDASIQERMITLAAEGIELPIATDHNVQIDYEAIARQAGVRRYFTPVTGNEVTTPVGHFNVFPVRAGAEPPNHRLNDWAGIFDEIQSRGGARVVILNHARDLHSGVRPFGPKRFNAAVGVSRLDWPFRMNGMETVNSGAIQTDVRQLFRDWMVLLNAGYRVTPVGSSDSHDVARHFVGQGRTYIRCDDRDAGNINVDQAVQSFVDGHVMVSYGLLAELSVQQGRQRSASGDMAAVEGDHVPVRVRVLGPQWASLSHVEIYANGELVREVRPFEDMRAVLRTTGVLWDETWNMPRPSHDVHLVAIATGPGVRGLHWPMAKPYQPVSPEWQPLCLGCSGAVWIDADDDGRVTPAREYAVSVVARADGDLSRVLDLLHDFDSAVAAQAAHLLETAGGRSVLSAESRQRTAAAAPQVRAGFERYIEAVRQGVMAEAE